MRPLFPREGAPVERMFTRRAFCFDPRYAAFSFWVLVLAFSIGHAAGRYPYPANALSAPSSTRKMVQLSSGTAPSER